MSKELTQKELIRKIAHWYLKNNNLEDQQAYDQIKETIKRNFAITNKWIEDLAEACYGAHEMGATSKYVIEIAMKKLGFVISSEKS